MMFLQSQIISSSNIWNRPW